MNTKSPTRITVLFILSLLLSVNGIAQVITGIQAEAMVKGSVEIRMDANRKSISFVRLRENNFVPAMASQQWLLSSVLGGRTADGLRLIKEESDKLGFTHYRFCQLYKNIPVEYAMYIVHTRNGKIISANGEYYPNIEASTNVAITAVQALQAAKNDVHAQSYITDPSIISSPETVMMRLNDGSYRLAYKTDVYAKEPLSRNWIYIDASTGSILKKINRIETIDVNATAVTRYSATKPIRVDSVSAASFRLRENVRGAGSGTYTKNLQNGSDYATATDFTNTTNSWPSAYDNAALDAHYGAEKTYDLYYTNYGYNSFDNAGGRIFSYVHYGTNYVNAFWDGTQMTYGDGDNFQYTPLTSLEIVGHEITHGLTERTAGLVYAGESGALNESFSDIMGMTIRFINDAAIATWYCGDQIVIPGGGGAPFRNMANPNEFENADTYGGLYWNNGDIVHYDSGVQNYWYYLLTHGGTGVNDNGDSYTVNGLGLTDANAITFRNLTVYLTPNSTFADARYYAIESAIDLFGNCSNQVIQTTNAWYAVGVGGVFSNAVVASFSATQNYFCTAPATVYFTNNSVNGTAFIWSFGDGGTSTASSPSHVYSTPGVYSVQLIATGIASCGNTDTTLIANYITVTNTGGPVSPSCTPTTLASCCGIGITRVQFNTLNNVSGNSTEGYKDFTCSNVTTLIAGDPYPITITTGFSSNENVKVWIDYNNDGVFNNTNELVFVSTNHINSHAGIIHTPVSATLNTPLRMRITDDAAGNNISSGCYNPQNGQAEDYTVSFVANTLPPVANFIASDTIVNAGSTVIFGDLSIHAPLSWQWSFPGGTPTGSTFQNPSVVYNTIGVYPVTLRVSNSFGADSITKTTYIHVVNYVYMCTASSTAAANGLLYDSGGPAGSYQNSEYCSFLISPACATSITLSFSSFQTEGGYDYLQVYDGPTTGSPLLYYSSGSTIPPPLTAVSGQMLIVFSSDGSVTYPGFSATWASVIASSIPPVADFIASDPTPPLNTSIQFTDNSTNSPVAWHWDFGDGNSSTAQNPAHAYLTSGVKNITLIAFTCSQSDTITKSVTVQGVPSVTVNPDTLHATVACGDSVTVTLTVYNGGPGDLVYSTNGGSTGPVKLLALTYGSDTTWEYPNTLLAINQYFTDYTLTRYSGTNASALQAALVGIDVLLMPEQENSLTTVWLSLTTVVQNFVNSGGIVVVCGSGSPYSQRIFDLGLFTGTGGGFSSSSLITLDTTDYLTDQVPLTFPNANATFPMTFTNPDKVKLVVPFGSTDDVVSYRNIGTGMAVYVGFDYYEYDAALEHLIANAVSLPHKFIVPWLQLNPNSDTIVAGDSSVIQVTFSTNGLYAGLHTTNIVLATNDPLHPTITVPCSLMVTGSPSIGLSASCLNFGTIMQYTSATDSVVVHNNGCDTLFITNINNALSAYSVSLSGLTAIPPYGSSIIYAQFHPTTVGAFHDTIHILNNDVNASVCLNGSSFAAPAISTVPDSFNVTINGCNDSITLPLWIHNHGGSDLIYTMDGLGIGIVGDTSVLVIQDFDPWGLSMSNLLQTDYGITPDVITSSQIRTADFTQYNIIITVGDQSTQYYDSVSAYHAKFAAFVSTGGKLQYQMATQGGTNVQLAGGPVMMYGNTENQNTGLIPTHPILNGLTNPLNGSYANHCYLTNLPADARIITETSITLVPTTIEYNIGHGVVIATGMTWEWLHLNTTYNASPMLDNALNYIFSNVSGLADWLSLSSSGDTIVPADSNLVYVTFSSGGLSAGVYHSSIVIHSNDPLLPEDTIPCTFTVVGTPSISVTASCLTFGNIMQYTTASDSFYIRNEGCDTLRISSLNHSLSAYTLSNTGALNVPPYDSVLIHVNFTPATVGTFNDTIHILNNDVNMSVCLTGSASAAPHISTNPLSFNVTLNACNDSTTLPLEIHNTGGSNLTYTISGFGSGGGTLEVLALTYGTDLGTEYPNTITAINQYFTNYNLTTLNTTSASTLQTALVGKNIFLMTEPETGTPSVYAGFASVLQNFVSNGGSVIMCGSYSTQSACILSTGLFSGSYGMDGTGGIVNVVNNSTSVTSGVSSSFKGTDGTYCLNLTNADKVKLIDYQGNDVVTYRQIGSGKVIYIGFDYYDYAVDQARIVANAMQWAGTNLLASWITLSSTSGTVTAGDSDLIDVTFHSANLPGGIYHTNIIIHSNDPLIPNDTVPCTLHVAFNPCAHITYTSDVCSGMVLFNSNAVNSPTSYLWHFGDGGSTSLANPVHIYSTPGSYNVQLIVCNGSGCDTVYQTVNISSINGPAPASCTPITTGNCCGMGIYNVTLGGINNTTADGSDGYRDYSCIDTTTLVRGQTYAISIRTGPTYNENTRAWIDFNNDGILAAGEIVYTSLNVLQYHTGNIVIPNSGIAWNVPLRLRIASDYYSNATPDGCSSIEYGQAEDYTVFITFGVDIQPVAPEFQTFQVYPNPFTDEASIEYNLDVSRKVTLEVHNVIGEKVSSILKGEFQPAGNYKVRLKVAEAGVYLVTFTTDDGSIIRRVVKMD